ncbi:transposon Tf2-6 polyprotein [Trichonephila clavipes]|nr:transposon Tf2-6 polyprotein [Trichonephila clavipes]
MAYLAKGRRQDLLELAETLDISIQDNFKILDIKDAILKSEGYDAEFTCECLNRIICDRKELELRAEREKENQRQFELQKLQCNSTTSDSNMPKLELHKLLPIFDPKTTDVTIFLDLFERQLTFLKVPIQQWVVYLVGLLPTEVSNLITKESFADAQDYYKVKQILLKRFKLSAEKFRQMFSRHTKDPVKTWRDFYFDLQTYFDGWLKESKVTMLEELRDLIVADQIKKKTPQDYKDHFLDQWCNWNNPLQLVDKLDSYEEVKNMRNKNNKNFSRKQKEMNSSPWRSNYTQNPKLSYEHPLSGFLSQSRRETGIPSNSRRNPISKDRIPEKKIVDTKEDRTPISCYGCGAPGIIRSRCHTCNPVRQKDDALSSSLNQSNFYSFSSESNPISIIQISICNTEAAVCADTGATHSVAGEKLYHLLKQKGLNFEEKTMQMTLADGRTQTTEILTTSVDISIQGKVIPTELLTLKNARGNRTLLGIDFLTAEGIVLDLQRKQWYFTETSHRKYNFVKATPNINALLTVDPKPHLCQLRKNEGGEPTPFIEHRINTRNHLPVAVPPYRMNPSKKEILKQEIDRLLLEGIIEKCESPYASPVVLIPKPNGTFRLCIDYRKLNEITVADTYPLPRMDDLLHQTKLTPFMSTLDLRAGYHQVKVHVEDQDSICMSFWRTYRFLRMPYGIEVDSEKVASILDIPPPKNVKELQSFLQTCSWFRRYIQDFAKISRPLSYLTKKKVKWQWGFDQQNAFQTLKNSLTTPPVLKQADGTKPYIIRTDASNYALGALLLQEGSDEHPIEYASRLLTPAERNYSTTEREALAVVWVLKKFRGCIEGTEITVSSDHQPLKWLLNLKSPTGRLARWALEIQSFNLKVQYIPGKANVVADMLSRPVTQEEESFCEENNITIADMPTRSCKDMREAQLKDDNLKKIIDSFESPLKTEQYANWTERGFLMNQGVLYRYVPDADSAEAQLVIPTAERELIMERHHNDPMAGHYGEEGTFQKIARRYYWTGMRKYISDYIKKCPECARFKATNQKPAGLLRTPVYSQRFEVIAIDLFGPLPQTDTGKQWIFIVEDCATKWVELFALSQASARQCATTLIEEIFMRHGIPRRIISDNGTQFVSAVLQQICFTLNISQNFIPVYSPQSNPVERKTETVNPDLQYLLETIILVGIPNSHVVHNDNFVAEITPYLKRFATITEDIRERIETKQDQRKKQYDKNSRPVYYSPGDKVWVTLHPISSAKNKKTSKFMPKRDGPYLILTQKSPTSYVIASLANPSEPIATYHTSALTPVKDINTSPVAPLRKRGRPRKVTSTSQNKHVPSPSTATTAVSNRTIHPSTRAITTTANYVSSPGRRRIHRGRL